MKIEGRQLQVHPGDGVVGRFGDVVIVVLPGGDDAFVDALLDLAERVGTSGESGRTFSRSFARFLFEHEEEGAAAPFAALTAHDRGIAVMVAGDAVFEGDGPAGAVSLSGLESDTWVDKIIADDLTAMRLGAPSALAHPPQRRVRLHEGTATGSGITFGDASVLATGATPVAEPAAPAPAPAAAPEPVPEPVAPAPAPVPEPVAAPAPAPAPVPEPLPVAAPAPASPTLPPPEPVVPPMPPPPAPEPLPVAAAPEPHLPTLDKPVQIITEPPTAANAVPPPMPTAGPAEDVEFEAVLLVPDHTDQREPLPVVGEAGSHVHELEHPAPIVKGVLCKRGHFNNPLSLYCTSCGISMVHETPDLVDGPRPPLGILVVDDGSTFSVDMGYVIGREPDGDPLVLSNEARVLVLTDPDRTISRVHAEVRLNGWDVAVIDRRSQNGTYILPQGAQEWIRLAPDQPTAIGSGTRVLVGRRVLIYDSHGV